jgi:drug/metabolite transporter (DMT)-like permease
LLAIVLRLCAAASISLMFALGKLAAGNGVLIVEIAFYRQLFALPLIVGWAWLAFGLGSLRTTRIGKHATRMAVGTVGMILNFLGMIMLPLAEATVIGFTVPLFATILAAVLLREHVGPWRWTAVLIGFVGIVIVLHPDSAMMQSNGAIIALSAAVMTAAVSILLRQLGATEAATTTVFWFTALSLPPLGLLMLFFAQAHDGTTWALLCAMGLIGGLAQLLLTGSLRLAPVSLVLPMDYSSLIWASITGWLLFAVTPARETLIGAPIIIASGLAILWREQHLARKRAAIPR